MSEAIENIRKAVGDRTGKSHVKVRAVDVITAFAGIKGPSPVVAMLAKGAIGALEGLNADAAEELIVVQYAGQLGELLAAADGKALAPGG